MNETNNLPPKLSCWDKLAKYGIRFPYAFDSTTNKPSVTLFFAYVSFASVLISMISLHFFNHLTATMSLFLLWTFSMVFYRMRRIDSFKANLNDKSIELKGDDK